MVNATQLQLLPKNDKSSLGSGKPLVISASRRTDLPGFHSRACDERIRRRIRGLRTRRLAGIVFWTRHARPFLSGGDLHRLAGEDWANPIVNFTVTGLGGTKLEPGVPPVEEILNHLPSLVESLHGEPWRLRWRFDPLLKDFSTIDMFRRIADSMSAVGVSTCTFSFPAYRSLKGDLTGQFTRAGIPRWEEREKADFIAVLVEHAQSSGIELLSCAQPENLALNPSIRKAACIPKVLLERGNPEISPLPAARDRSQRTDCCCIESEDIGCYETDRCGGGCAYCYSKAGGP